jgi:hypothetical protein
MVFILAADGRDDDVAESFQRYRNYLETVRQAFPSSAYNIATSAWFHDFDDRRCPHDAWLESCNLSESPAGAQHQHRTLSLTVKLIGSHQDRIIELRYPRVFSYHFSVHSGERGQRDWRYDELRLSERGHLIHEIEWYGSHPIGSWTIEASDVEIGWVLMS